VLPTVVARDLDRDPERLSLLCVEALEYARAKAAYDHAGGDRKKLDAWSGSQMMDLVESATFELVAEELKGK